MNLIGQEVLVVAGRNNKPLRRWLLEWAAVVQQAEWQGIKDVRKLYPSADAVTLKSRTIVTLFNVKGNAYRLATWIDYESGMIEALEVMTHAEYDKDRWKARY